MSGLRDTDVTEVIWPNNTNKNKTVNVQPNNNVMVGLQRTSKKTMCIMRKIAPMHL